jgi:transmembrane sensor
MDSMNDERTLGEAARWRARLLAPDCTPAEHEAAQSWAQRDPAHAQAADRANAVLGDIDRLAASPKLGGNLKALADEAFAAYGLSPYESGRGSQARSRRWLVPVALAASLAIVAMTLRQSAEQLPDSAPSIAYETNHGQQQTITLEDGSVVQLDVATAITVRMTPQRRELELLSGRALFKVAHDSDRPFTVTAAGARTTALGTQFQVQHEDQKVVVTLAEGSVAIDDSDRDSHEAWRERLRPGEQLSIDSATSTYSRRLVDAQIVTSWTHGRHVFRGTPLREALDEVNRYATRKVRLGDPALADLPVAGNFIAGDSDVVVAAFAAVLPLRVVASGDREIILFRRYDAGER